MLHLICSALSSSFRPSGGFFHVSRFPLVCSRRPFHSVFFFLPAGLFSLWMLELLTLQAGWFHIYVYNVVCYVLLDFKGLYLWPLRWCCDVRSWFQFCQMLIFFMFCYFPAVLREQCLLENLFVATQMERCCKSAWCSLFVTLHTVNRMLAACWSSLGIQLLWVANPLYPLLPPISYYYCYCFCMVFQQLSALIFTAVIRWISVRQLYTGSEQNKLHASHCGAEQRLRVFWAEVIC